MLLSIQFGTGLKPARPQEMSWEHLPPRQSGGALQKLLPVHGFRVPLDL
jgi:hypothetical protein